MISFSDKPDEEMAEEEDEVEESLEHYDPDPGVVKDWRQDMAMSRKKIRFLFFSILIGNLQKDFL
jgi:hypothetical protein